jgi:hypothetical protein
VTISEAAIGFDVGVGGGVVEGSKVCTATEAGVAVGDTDTTVLVGIRVGDGVASGAVLFQGPKRTKMRAASGRPAPRPIPSPIIISFLVKSLVPLLIVFPYVM